MIKKIEELKLKYSIQSVEDLLNRYLNVASGITAVAIYKTDGNLVAKKERTKNNIK